MSRRKGQRRWRKRRRWQSRKGEKVETEGEEGGLEEEWVKEDKDEDNNVSKFEIRNTYFTRAQRGSGKSQF